MTINDFAPVVRLVESVGRRIDSWRNDKEARKIHSVSDFKTKADRLAHDLLVEGLGQLCSGVDVVSEEDQFHDDLRPDVYWLIDPIDGTASWYEGYNGFVCQVAYLEYGIPIFGVIHAPALQKTWRALLSAGAFLNNEKLQMLNKSDRLIVIDNYPTPRHAAETLVKNLPATGYYESGSIGLKGALVADGTADIFAKDVVVRDWDIAPIVPILLEVGGTICQLDGAAYEFIGSYAKPRGVVIACTKDLSDRAISILQKYAKNS